VNVIENINPLLAIALITGLLSIYYFFSLVSKIKKLKLISSVSRFLTFLIFAFVSLTLSIILFGTQGYQSLTKEEQVAVVKISPIDKQVFNARLILQNGEQQLFNLKGDELLIDAYILKWKPWVNILGIHTAYRLERVSGRYKDINDEKQKERSIFAIKNANDAGIAKWRDDYSFLSFLLDVEHGSASFVNADITSEYELMVTTDGLLIRPVKEKL
jgi:hypothetical protein